MQSFPGLVRKCTAAPMFVLCAPPTAVGGAHNSPIANGTMTLKSGLVHYMSHLYNQSGVFYFPWHRHQVEGPTSFSILSEKTRAISGKVFFPESQAHVTDTLGFGLSVDNHCAIVLDAMVSHVSKALGFI